MQLLKADHLVFSLGKGPGVKSPSHEKVVLLPLVDFDGPVTAMSVKWWLGSASPKESVGR